MHFEPPPIQAPMDMQVSGAVLFLSSHLEHQVCMEVLLVLYSFRMEMVIWLKGLYVTTIVVCSMVGCEQTILLIENATELHRQFGGIQAQTKTGREA